MNCPVYPPFYPFVEHLDRRVVEAPLGAGPPDRPRRAGGRVPAGHARTGARPRTCCAARTTRPARCTPPTELAAVAALANAYGVRVVADEIHAPLVLPGADVRALPERARGGERVLPDVGVQGVEPGRRSRPRSRWPGRRPSTTSGGCPRRSATARATWASSPTPPRCATAATGSTRCSPGWTTTAACWPTCSPSTCPAIGYPPPQGTYLAWLDCRGLGLGEAWSGGWTPRDGPARSSWSAAGSR